MEGDAIDVRVRDVTDPNNPDYVGTAEVAEISRCIAKEHGTGGVGYYENSRFVHVDTGRLRNWGGEGQSIGPMPNDRRCAEIFNQSAQGVPIPLETSPRPEPRPAGLQGPEPI
jgi:hypothetical protein